MNPNQRSSIAWLALLGTWLIVTPLLASCTPLSATAYNSVEPVRKIGLIAPFEGLYRRTGYEALNAMRQAIHDAGAGDIGLLPLALDDSADPARAQRAAEKLLASTDVGAVIGPLTPNLATAVTPILETRAPATIWIAPHAVDPAGGFAAPNSEAWADGLVAAVAQAARQQGVRRLILAGWHEGWPAHADDAWEQIASMPVRVTDAPDAVTINDAVFWLGAADTGAAYLQALRRLNLTPPFWLGPSGGDPVFLDHAPDTQDVYWVTWSNVDYNAWADGRSPASPSAFVVYNATLAAIAHITDSAVPPNPMWRVVAFTFDDAGISIPFSFRSDMVDMRRMATIIPTNALLMYVEPGGKPRHTGERSRYSRQDHRRTTIAG